MQLFLHGGIYRVYEEASTDRKLRKAIGEYLALIDKIRQGQSLKETDKSVLSPNCKKILNGEQINKSREEFINDLETIYRIKGGWTVTPLKTVCSSKEKTVILRLAVVLQEKSYAATVMFLFNRNDQISTIDETFAEAQGTYQLEERK